METNTDTEHFPIVCVGFRFFIRVNVYVKYYDARGIISV